MRTQTGFRLRASLAGAGLGFVFLAGVYGSFVLEQKRFAQEIGKPIAGMLQQMSSGLAENFGSPRKVTQAAVK